jgi:xanthine dehydrogenase accessory factor
MRDVWEQLLQWEAEKREFALARVVETWGSAPRGVGAAMLVDKDLQIAGSVSGGCIEGDVIEEAKAVLETGTPKQLTYGVDDETAFSVGLSCGGEVTVLLERSPCLSPLPATQSVWEAFRARVNDNKPAVLLTRLSASTDGSHPLLVDDEGTVTGEWGALTAAARGAALKAYEARQSAVAELGGERVFIQVFPRRDQLIIIGAGHLSIPLVQFVRQLEIDTVVIDPRRVFATPERFPVQPSQLLARWPEEVLEDWDLNDETYAVVLTHDPKIDDQALHYFLRSPVAYIGALGGRKSHGKRRERLREAGFDDAAINRIKGPVGLDIGAETAAEIALSIAAEVVAVKRSRQG